MLFAVPSGISVTRVSWPASSAKTLFTVPSPPATANRSVSAVLSASIHSGSAVDRHSTA